MSDRKRKLGTFIDNDFRKGRKSSAVEDLEAIQQFRQTLPVLNCRKEIVQNVINNFVTIVVGETGSGKSTQIPQYLSEAPELELLFEERIRICVTQPRRMAAIAMAYRVARERGERKLGEGVGYSIRFSDCSSDNTNIKFVTDGIALREILATGGFTRYQVLMIDEAHERSLSTDILLALIKKAIPAEGDVLPRFRVVISSATLDVEKFSLFYHNAPVVKIPGRCYPVDIVFAPLFEDSVNQNQKSSSALNLSPSYNSTSVITAAVNAALRLHLAPQQPHFSSCLGHILVFLTGRAECERACELAIQRLGELVAEHKEVGDALVIPLYGALSPEDQALVFASCDKIRGVEFVIDMGFVKQKGCNPATGVETLSVVRIAKSQAVQRAGRAGRSRAGKCFRIYADETFKNSVILQLKSLGFEDVISVEFLDPPPRAAIIASLKQLFLLGALSADGQLTDLGRQMVSLPLDPIYAKALITARKEGVEVEVAGIVAVLSAESIWNRPVETRISGKSFVKSEQVNLSTGGVNQHRQFLHKTGDHMTLLNALEAFCGVQQAYRQRWCKENSLNFRALSQSEDIRSQLLDLLSSVASKAYVDKTHRRFSRTEEILRALSSGCFVNSAKMSSSTLMAAASRLGEEIRATWVTLKDGLLVGIERTSALLLEKKLPEYVIFHEVACNQPNLGHRSFLVGHMSVVSKIDKKWIDSLIQRFAMVDLKALTASTNVPLHASTQEPLKPFQAAAKSPEYEVEGNNAKADCSSIEAHVRSARERYLARRHNN